MKRVAIIILVGAFLAALVVGAVTPAKKNGGSPASTAPTWSDGLDVVAHLKANLPQNELYNPVYVGAEYCIACHGRSGWRGTGHATFLRRAMVQYSLVAGKGVVADYDGNQVDDFIQGLDFNAIAGPFDAYKPNAPILGVTDGNYWMKIGEVTYPLVFTLGGGLHGQNQRYIFRIPVTDTANHFSAAPYFGPISYTPGTGWAAYSPNNWWDATTKLPKYNSSTASSALVSHTGNHAKGCTGCHMTGIKTMFKTPAGEVAFKGYPAVLYQDDDPSYFDYDGDGQFDLANISCETCHGPGSLHILGGGDITKIYNGENPDDGDAIREIESCGRCHSRPASVPSKMYNFPYNETTNQQWNVGLGVPLADYSVDIATYWPDGKNSKNGRQYMDFLHSGKPTFQFHQVRCSECHSFHSQSTNEAQIRPRITVEATGLRINTNQHDNTLCLACHATHGPFATLTFEQVAAYGTDPAAKAAIDGVVGEHTHHTVNPAGDLSLSNCINCHMPQVGAGHDHNFEAIAPKKTLDFQAQGGMPNACAVSCHGGWPLDFGLSTRGQCIDATTWNKPYDVNLANYLMQYYGPGGLWWNTDESAPAAMKTAITPARAHAEYEE